MSNFPLIDIAVSIIFIYLLLSLICSAVKELIEAKWKKRASNLREGIERMLGPELAKKLYKHGLINALSRDNDLPSYIPARTFAMALLDLAKDRTALPAPLKQALDAIGAEAGNDAAKVRSAVEDWYNVAMDRVSGWYKRHTQLVLFAIGCIVTIALNVDSVRIVDALGRNPAMAAAISKQAEELNKQPMGVPNPGLQDAQKQLAGFGLPIGWNGADDGRLPPWAAGKELFGHTWTLIRWHWAGWLITMIAASFGAPFWFDLLNRFMVVRSTVKPEEKSPPEPAKS